MREFIVSKPSNGLEIEIAAPRVSAGASYTPWQVARRPIAVVDDSLDDQMALRRELSYLFGKTPVIAFHHGAALMNYLEDHTALQEKPWLIVLDMHMPRMDGLRTLDLLAECRDYAEIPVLVVSATENDNEIQTALQKGARGFMHKPLSRHEFMDVLNGKAPHEHPR